MELRDTTFGVPAVDVDPAVPKYLRAKLTLAAQAGPASGNADSDNKLARFGDVVGATRWALDHQSQAGNNPVPRGAGSTWASIWPSQISGGATGTTGFNVKLKIRPKRDELDYDPDYEEEDEAVGLYVGYLRTPKFVPTLTLRGTGHTQSSRNPLVFPMNPLVAQHNGPDKNEYSSYVHDIFDSNGVGALDVIVRAPLSSIFRVTDIDGKTPLNIGGATTSGIQWDRVVALNFGPPNKSFSGGYGAAFFEQGGSEIVAMLGAGALGPLAASSNPDHIVGVGPLGHINTHGALITWALYNYNTPGPYFGRTAPMIDWAPGVDYNVKRQSSFQIQCKYVWDKNHTYTWNGKKIKGVYRMVAFSEWKQYTPPKTPSNPSTPSPGTGPSSGSSGGQGGGGGSGGGGGGAGGGGRGGRGGPGGRGRKGKNGGKGGRRNGPDPKGDEENEQDEDPERRERIKKNPKSWLERREENLRERLEKARSRGHEKRAERLEEWLEEIVDKIEERKREEEERARRRAERKGVRSDGGTDSSDNESDEWDDPTKHAGQFGAIGSRGSRIDDRADGMVSVNRRASAGTDRSREYEQIIDASSLSEEDPLDDGAGPEVSPSVATLSEVESPSRYTHPKPALPEDTFVRNPGVADGVGIEGADPSEDGEVADGTFHIGGVNPNDPEISIRNTHQVSEEEFNEVGIVHHEVGAPVYDTSRNIVGDKNPNKRWPVELIRRGYVDEEGNRRAAIGPGSVMDLPGNITAAMQFLENKDLLPSKIPDFTRIIGAVGDGSGNMLIDGRFGLGMRSLESARVASGIEARLDVSGIGSNEQPDVHWYPKSETGADGDQSNVAKFKLHMDLSVTGRALMEGTAFLQADKPLNVGERATEPSAPSTDDIYLDDGSNTANGNPGWRRYNGSSWEDIANHNKEHHRVSKESDEQYVSATLSDDSDLQLTLPAGRYIIKGVVFATVDTAATGAKFAFGGTLTEGDMKIRQTLWDTANSDDIHGITRLTSIGDTYSVITAGTTLEWEFQGEIEVTGDGTITVQGARVIGSGTYTIQKNSFLEAIKI